MKEKNVVLEWTVIEGSSAVSGSVVFSDRKEVRK